MSRQRKQSDSPSDFDREIGLPAPLIVRETIRHQEDGVRRLTNDRWWRRVQALMPSEAPVVVHEFDTECTL